MNNQKLDFSFVDRYERSVPLGETDSLSSSVASELSRRQASTALSATWCHVLAQQRLSAEGALVLLVFVESFVCASLFRITARWALSAVGDNLGVTKLGRNCSQLIKVLGVAVIFLGRATLAITLVPWFIFDVRDVGFERLLLSLGLSYATLVEP